MRKRLFIGIPSADEYSKPIASFVNKYSDLQPINWVSEKNLHITIYFIGSIEENSIPIISNQINFLINNSKQFALEFEEVCFMKGRKNQKMIWAKFKESNELNELAKKIEGICLLYIDKREPFISTIPHITIARMKQYRDIEKIKIDIPFKTNKITVKKSCLYESVSIEGGVRYEVLNTFNFSD
jgi:2'-5' RNA ligase